MKNLLRISVIVLISLILFTNAIAMGRQYGTATNLNKQASDFSLSDTEGKKVSLSDFKDKKNLVLFFWTTWCPHCRREIRHLNVIHDELKENDTEILAIDVDESLSKIEEFTIYNPVSFDVLLDSDAKVAQDYDIFGVPTFIVINKAGIITLVDHELPENYQEFISD